MSGEMVEVCLCQNVRWSLKKYLAYFPKYFMSDYLPIMLSFVLAMKDKNIIKISSKYCFDILAAFDLLE